MRTRGAICAISMSVCAAAASVAPWPAPPGAPLAIARAAQAQDAQRYEPPVDAAVVDRFREPAPNPYGAGNRGWEYSTAPGTQVRASAPGEVLFAGTVASALHVTVLHSDGLRTSYSYLATVSVEVGQHVERGAPVGTAGPRLHFGIRDADGTYLDPASVLGDGPPPRPRLVPGAGEGRAALRAGERWALLDLVRATWDLAADGAAAAGAVADEGLAVLSHYRHALDPTTRLARLAGALERWRRSRGECTPSGVSPRRAAGRRVVVLVAGLGSTSSDASVDDVDVESLGYEAGDVLRFSYAGGRVPDERDGAWAADLPASRYESVDTQGDIRVAAVELAELLALVAAANPGVPLDVIAHSQGGLVARLALSSTGAPTPVELETVVTLGTPHGGSDLATAATALRALRPAAVSTEARVASAAGLDPDRPAIRQLAETSDLVTSLDGTEVAGRAPDGSARQVRFVSVGARGDLVVPVPRTVVAGEPHVVVPISGFSAHSDLPGSPAATREIALAVAGQPPTCASFTSALVDAVTGEAISVAADAYGASRAAGWAAGVGIP